MYLYWQKNLLVWNLAKCYKLVLRWVVFPCINSAFFISWRNRMTFDLNFMNWMISRNLNLFLKIRNSTTRDLQQVSTSAKVARRVAWWVAVISLFLLQRVDMHIAKKQIFIHDLFYFILNTQSSWCWWYPQKVQSPKRICAAVHAIAADSADIFFLGGTQYG